MRPLGRTSWSRGMRKVEQLNSLQVNEKIGILKKIIEVIEYLLGTSGEVNAISYLWTYRRYHRWIIEYCKRLVDRTAEQGKKH
jgi:hypothetical protein